MRIPLKRPENQCKTNIHMIMNHILKVTGRIDHMLLFLDIRYLNGLMIF